MLSTEDGQNVGAVFMAGFVYKYNFYTTSELHFCESGDAAEMAKDWLHV